MLFPRSRERGHIEGIKSSAEVLKRPLGFRAHVSAATLKAGRNLCRWRRLGVRVSALT